MKMSPQISIITINYNGLKDTEELILSLTNHLVSISYEIIVVDNASKADEASILKAQFPSITVIRSKSNLGFSGGNNLGIKEAKGEYLLLLNNDTIIKDDTIHFLVDRLKSDSSIGAVSPKIKFDLPPFCIQFAGYTPLSGITLRNSLIGFGQMDGADFEKAHTTPYCHGAAMMIKKEVIDKAGYMPQIYFLYYEELDWCTQIEKAGYTLWYEPLCTVYHKESQSTGQHSPLRTFYMTRNRLLYAWRNRTGLQKWIAILYQLFVANPKNYIMFRLTGKAHLAKAIINGINDFIKLDKDTN